MQFKELVFSRDIANWCVYRCNDVGSAVAKNAELYMYEDKDNKYYKEWRFVVLSPDKPSEIASRYAINHDSKLSDEFKKRILYETSNNLNYVLILYEPLRHLLYCGYNSFITDFNENKPWIDSDNRNFEIFALYPKELVAKVIAYNSYTKHNETMLLTKKMREEYAYYTFKEKKDGLKLLFEDTDDKTALEHCLNHLKYGTCLTPIETICYFKK